MNKRKFFSKTIGLISSMKVLSDSQLCGDLLMIIYVFVKPFILIIAVEFSQIRNARKCL